jgi:hypothetical protein
MQIKKMGNDNKVKRELTYDEIFSIADMLKGTDFVLATKDEIKFAI